MTDFRGVINEEYCKWQKEMSHKFEGDCTNGKKVVERLGKKLAGKSLMIF